MDPKELLNKVGLMLVDGSNFDEDDDVAGNVRFGDGVGVGSVHGGACGSAYDDAYDVDLCVNDGGDIVRESFDEVVEADDCSDEDSDSREDGSEVGMDANDVTVEGGYVLKSNVGADGDELVNDEVMVEVDAEVVRKGGHHVGPIKKCRMEDQKARINSFNKRRKTIMQRAMDIHTICDGKVALKVESADTKKVYSYYSEERSFINRGVQVGESAFPTRSSQRNSIPAPVVAYTPKKLKRASMPDAPKINNLPGKKRTPLPQTIKKKKVSRNNACQKHSL